MKQCFKLMTMLVCMTPLLFAEATKLQGNFDQATLAEIVKTDKRESMRWEAVQRLTDQATLAEVVKNDPALSVRFQAVKKLTDPVTLADIAKNDKNEQIRQAAEKKLNVINWDKSFPVEQAIALGLSKVPIKTDYPGLSDSHTHSARELKDDGNLDLHPWSEPRPPIYVPVGCDKLLSRGCKVTSSDPDPVIGELSDITDGNKEHEDGYVELSPGLQWIQIDLGEEREIHAICIWHFHGNRNVDTSMRGGRVYRDVIVLISNDKDFKKDVVTVFNNDYDNSAGFGKGKDKEYIESNYGRPFAVDAVRGRYVRCYSRGNNQSEMNNYTEVEVFGRHIEQKQQADADNAEVRRKKAEQQ